jgi:hypothetical protein
MIYCALIKLIPLITLLGSLTTAGVSTACVEVFDGKESTIPIELTSTQKIELRVSSYEIEGGSGRQKNCIAAISVPLSAYPSVRLVSRPGDFASDIREILAEWQVSECDVVVWVENDTGDELSEEEACMIEKFRYDGDSVWSSSSEKPC